MARQTFEERRSRPMEIGTLTPAQERLISEITAEMRLCAPHTGRAQLKREVLDALTAVPREAFVLDRDRDLAYVNEALSIGHGQTISQPFIVALMTDLMDVRATDIVLEVGTGSGYQAAIAARLVKHVYSVEVVPELADRARRVLERLGVANVSIKAGDGNLGWPEHGPYDAILVTAAAAALPVALLAQLKPGGRLICPIGKPWGLQDLTVTEKQADGSTLSRSVLPVRFVPLVDDR